MPTLRFVGLLCALAAGTLLACVPAGAKVAPGPQLKVPKASVAEGKALKITVGAVCPVRRCTFRASTHPGSALDVDDFLPLTKRKTVARGGTLKLTLTIRTIADTTCEPAERFAVRLAAALSGRTRVSTLTATQTITDDDCPPNAGVVGQSGPPAGGSTPAPPSGGDGTPPGGGPAPAPMPPSGPPPLPPDSGTPTFTDATTGTTAGTTTSRTCLTPMWIGVPGQFGANGNFNAGCDDVRLTCPAAFRICSVTTSARHATEQALGHTVTMNARLRIFSAAGVEFFHRDKSCAGTDACTIVDEVFIRGGESAANQCNGVRQTVDGNRSQITCAVAYVPQS